jgi:hypothetical protein
LPQSIKFEWLIGTLGIDETFAFVWQFGGRRLYIPRHTNRHGRLARFLGHDSFALLTERYGPGIYMPPLAPVFCIHYLCFVKGLSTSEICRLMRMTESGVHRARQKPLPSYFSQRAKDDVQRKLHPAALKRLVFQQLGLSERDVARYGGAAK